MLVCSYEYIVGANVKLSRVMVMDKQCCIDVLCMCRNVTYHNWRHAFNVAQTMFAIIQVRACGLLTRIRTSILSFAFAFFIDR